MNQYFCSNFFYLVLKLFSLTKFPEKEFSGADGSYIFLWLLRLTPNYILGGLAGPSACLCGIGCYLFVIIAIDSIGRNYTSLLIVHF